MQNFFFILLSCVFVCLSCKGQADTVVKTPIKATDTTKPFRKEIPTYKDGSTDIFYSLAKTKQKQLGLDSMESGFDGLQIRIWYDFSLVRERKLVVLVQKDLNWTATLYNLQVDWDGRTETILSKTIKQVAPKDGWPSFSKRLLDLQILTLPNQDDVPGYGGGLDGVTYNIEVATKNQYRFYGYWGPQYYKDKFWQAKNLVDILSLLSAQLGV